jgi:hypothetical protein
VAAFVRARLQPGDSVLVSMMLNPPAIRYYLPNDSPGQHQSSASWHHIILTNLQKYLSCAINYLERNVLA